MVSDAASADDLVGIVADLTVAFHDRVVIKGVNLKLRQGHLTVIIGRSGSGKTTLLRAFNRLNDYYPAAKSSGTLRLRFQDAWQDIYQDGVDLQELRRRVGMVFQNPNVLPLSVEKNITLPVQLVCGLSKKACAGRLEEVLQQVGLWHEVKDRLRLPAALLSGGQQQRLCLARTLALEPEFLLLDEPTANLDFRTAQDIEGLLLSLKERCQILVVSHSLTQARRLAEQLAVLKNGELSHLLTPAEFQQPEVWQQMIEDIF